MGHCFYKGESGSIALSEIFRAVLEIPQWLFDRKDSVFGEAQESLLYERYEKFVIIMKSRSWHMVAIWVFFF